MTALMLHGIMKYRPCGPSLPPDVVMLRSGTLLGVCSAFVPTHANLAEDERVESEVSAALNHHDILCTISKTHDIAPIRFGSVFSSERALRADIHEKTSLYGETLERLRGHQELALALTADGRTGQVAEGRTTYSRPSGRDYLQARRGAKARREDLSAQREAFAERTVAQFCLTATQTTQAPDRRGRLVATSLLVARDRAADLCHAARALEEDAASLGLQLTLKGPWPPYSFCEKTHELANG
ncbi:MAG: GvpL/GvpF family gas vesicle protein [Pseudomonadota bacterium]